MSQSAVTSGKTVKPPPRQRRGQMTPAERAKASRTAQGLPPTVSDTLALGRIASLIVSATPPEASEGSGQAA